MQTINSLDNPKVKLLDQLKHKKYRKQHSKFLAEGFNTCSTLVQKLSLNSIFTLEEHLEEVKKITPENKIFIINKKILNKISNATTPSGIIAIFDIPKTKAKLTEGIILAQIQDPGNMGTLIRTAAAMNLKTVVSVESVDVWSPKVVQATAGTIANLNIFEISWQELLEKKDKLELCALVVKDGKDAEDIDFKNKLLVIGNEAQGIPKEWTKDCEKKLTLQMPGKTESLNAAVAGSVAMYLAFSK
ncbi:hypothetical protein A3F66_04140 [candidate division TM6 bacterium RIFCSPHIGHO2_12_FULL_32_22]|nr:MAG: hypothetical protein A3F66_04140 [candidate division TM6 bacterium RIFCSPHIGHO2_12_FULL_32_22]